MSDWGLAQFLILLLLLLPFIAAVVGLVYYLRRNQTTGEASQAHPAGRHTPRPGWYEVDGVQRYWNGREWTGQAPPGGQAP